MQLQAGYVLSEVEPALIAAGYDKNKITGLFNSLSYFEFCPSLPIQKNNEDIDSILAVANNIITRGLPTFTSIYIEEAFSKLFHLTERQIDDTGGINYLFKNPNSEFLLSLYKSLHIIEPEQKIDEGIRNFRRSWEDLGSTFEEDFIYNQIPNYINKYLTQIIESQRDIISIIRYATDVKEGYEKYLNSSIENFTEQKVDFSIEVPYKINDKNGMAIEIDGSQHDSEAQRILDGLRDDALLKSNWFNTLRIKTSDFLRITELLEPLKTLTSNEYFNILNTNFDTPLYNSTVGLISLQFILTPIAIARIHRSLLIAIINGWLNLNDKLWKIGILERDVPCAFYAIEDFKQLFSHLFNLEGQGRTPPQIDLKIEQNNRFKNSVLSKQYQESEYDLEEKTFDLFLDVSVLSREYSTEDQKNNSKYSGIIRSSFSKKSERTFFNSNLNRYKELIDFNQNENGLYNLDKINSLKYFLNMIFRKYSFRPGQLEILNRSLQLESVVGLLPTGAGKSLAYQLSALLQPGVTIIVDPIKSLMKDQHQGLIKQKIDASVFINSTLKLKERKLAADKMIKANIIFIFVSPERLQIKNFRDSLTDMYKKYENTFSYCVIDEAHCVSEWGHDFRTSYLRLGENARIFCKVKSKDIESIPLIGLTATASFDVLSDVQRELKLNEEAIIRSDSSDRPELIYLVWKLNGISQGSDFQNKMLLGETKQDRLIDLVKNIPKEFDGYQKSFLEDTNRNKFSLKRFEMVSFFKELNLNKNTGIIFCPHKTWLFGVKSVAAKIQQEIDALSIGTFMGSSGEDEKEIQEESQISELNQEKFINNDLDILVATKAFGMGIDKPNIRYTIHFNYPSSIEGFYQEAGRAGRDGKLAICYILFTGHNYEQELLESFHKNSFKGEKKEKFLLNELLDEISYSSDINISKLADEIEDENGLELNFNLWPKVNSTRLYVNKSFKVGYGYIDINSAQLYPDQKSFSLQKSNEVLNLVKEKILELKENNQSIQNWITDLVHRKSVAGIERQLSKIQIGEKLNPITVSFRNDKIKKINELLGNNFTERIVLKASEYCFSGDEFIEKLKKEYWKQLKQNADIPNNIYKSLKVLFMKIRSELDSFKAIYRLSIIGVIDDYQIDYNSKTITLLEITKKKDVEYINNLYNYIRRYVSKSRAEKVKLEIYNCKGNSIIQKCLGYLIDFVYNEIAKKRHEAINSMADACIKGAEAGPEEFREYLSLYFNSKYYPELRDKTSLGKEFYFELVLEYMNISEGNVDNLKHLRGACIRLLNENTDNAALLLLKSFTLFLLEFNNEKFLNEAKTAYTKGFEIFKESKNITIMNYIHMINEFNNKIISFSSDLTEVLNFQANILLVSYHSSWLESFNKKFMVKNGRSIKS